MRLEQYEAKSEQEERERLLREKEKQEFLVQEATRLKAVEKAENRRKAEAEKKWQEEKKSNKELEETAKRPAVSIKNPIGMEFVLIPAGEFEMGSNEFNNEKPIHKVKISKPFHLTKYPITQREWNAVMNRNPSNFKGNDRPVESVSWNEVQEFIKKLNSIENTNKYRLSSEAEWEYACRAGTTTTYFFGNDEFMLSEYAWYY